jgi:hypothetical protein
VQWTELERILQLDADTNGVARATASFWTCQWTDAWGVYEDVCLVCARLCSGLWRSSDSSNDSNDRDQWSWAGSPRARRERRATQQQQVRALGEGIEGRPASSYRRRGSSRVTGKQDDDHDDDNSDVEEDGEDGAVLVRSRQTRTTLALLQTFHAQTRFFVERLAVVLTSSSGPEQLLTPRDLLVLELGPLSCLDARFVEWLAEDYAAEGGARVCVRRGWRDLLGGFVGAAVGGSGTAS